MPGSQAPFSFIPDPDEKKEVTSFISGAAYDVYIPLSPSIQICLLPNQNFEKNPKDPADPAEPWIQDLSGFLPICTGLKAFHQRNPRSFNTS